MIDVKELMRIRSNTMFLWESTVRSTLTNNSTHNSVVPTKLNIVIKTKAMSLTLEKIGGSSTFASVVASMAEWVSELCD